MADAQTEEVLALLVEVSKDEALAGISRAPKALVDLRSATEEIEELIETEGARLAEQPQEGDEPPGWYLDCIVVPQHRGACMAAAMGLVEHYLNAACGYVAWLRQETEPNLRQDCVKKAMKYLRGCGFNAIEERDWKDLATLYKVRNSVVHHHGLVSERIDGLPQLLGRFRDIDCSEGFFDFGRDFNKGLFEYLDAFFNKSMQEIKGLDPRPPVARTHESEEEILRRFGLEPDPVIEAFKKDVDRTLLRQNLARTLDERLQNLAAVSKLADEFRRAGVKARAG